MSTKKITVSLSEKTIQMLEQLAERKGLKKSALVTVALDEYAKQQGGAVDASK